MMNKSIEYNLEQIMLITNFSENKELIRMVLRMVFNDGRLYQVKEDAEIYRNRIK